MKSIHPEIEEQVKLVRNALQTSSNLEAILESATTVCRLASQLKDTFGYDLARLCLAVVHTAMKNLKVAMSIYEEIWDSIERDADDSTILWMYAMRIRAFQDMGDWENSFLYNYKGIEVAKQRKSDVVLVELFFTISLTFERLGQYSQAMSNLDTAITLARALGEKLFLAKALSMYANILVHALKNMDRAREIYQEVLIIAREIDNHFLMSIALSNIASVHPDPESNEVCELYEEALVNARQTNIPFAIANNLFAVGEWYSRQKKYAKAKKLFQEILRIAKKTPDDDSNFWLGYCCLARLYWVQKKYDLCRRYLSSATSHLSQHAYASEKAETYSFWYTLERACNNNDEALVWLEKAHDMEKQITLQQQEEASKTALVAVKVEALHAQLEEERQRTKDMQQVIDQHKSVLVATSLELEQKKQALQKIKKIASNTLKQPNDSILSVNADESSLTEELQTYLRNLGNDESSWERFKENLEHLHPKFTKRLLEHCPELSPMQIRICCLLRLQLSSKEIAEILKLSKKTVDNHREHIRIKLDIPRTVNLVTCIMNI